MKIWKFVFQGAEASWRIPKGAEILTAQVQDVGGISLWLKVDPDQPTEVRRFVIFGTGHEMGTQKLKYISTVQMGVSGLVWHVFEVLP